ncbi:uncharacterized [Tachysurus ichikawai]
MTKHWRGSRLEQYFTVVELLSPPEPLEFGESVRETRLRDPAGHLSDFHIRLDSWLYCTALGTEVASHHLSIEASICLRTRSVELTAPSSLAQETICKLFNFSVTPSIARFSSGVQAKSARKGGGGRSVAGREREKNSLERGQAC